eukprot:comp23810_c0_seq4/m.41429 comp23810_c0_seq4/g.41429  ORF comp23810_c0_seq4/g.41429 comp23810_c0_seq4/m.41429 type:complete len:143 (+) comp23810_c0_seq4:57-485(+)
MTQCRQALPVMTTQTSDGVNRVLWLVDCFFLLRIWLSAIYHDNIARMYIVRCETSPPNLPPDAWQNWLPHPEQTRGLPSNQMKTCTLAHPPTGPMEKEKLWCRMSQSQPPASPQLVDESKNKPRCCLLLLTILEPSLCCADN